MTTDTTRVREIGVRPRPRVAVIADGCVEIRCDGVAVDAARATGRVAFTCPAADDADCTFEVIGTPVE